MEKIVLVTGGSSGIGRAICEYLATKKYGVYGSSRSAKKIKEKLPFKLVSLDVTKPETVKQAIENIISTEGRIDVLINNAGVGITGAVEETPIEEVTKNFETNYIGPLNCIKAVLPYMRKQQQGLIINITSLAAYMGLPYRGIYSASKAALELTAEALSMEVQQFGVKVVNLAPGGYRTKIQASRFHTAVDEKSVYYKHYGQILEQINSSVSQGGNPAEVAQLVHQIILKSKPALHYKSGAFLERFSIVLKRLLPDRVYERMLMKHYNLML